MRDKVLKWLNDPVYNDALIIFRIAFGFIMFCEAVFWLFSGYLDTYVIDPKMTFTFFGFEFLETIRGQYMYFHFGIMAFFALCIMVGKYTRFSSFMFLLFFACFYYMQKTFYNNHYYLTLLLAFFLSITPSGDKWSLDAKRKGAKLKCPRWCLFIFALQLYIVYTYAALNKLYPDWLSGKVIELFLYKFRDVPVVGEVASNKVFILFSAYFSIFYDGCIVYLLLWKRTRTFGIVLSLAFHLVNSLVFQVGSFPYMSLVLLLFFLPPHSVHLFMKRFQPKEVVSSVEIIPLQGWKVILLFVYFSLQVILPLRHHFLKGNVLYTEEGNCLSWRMMLKSTTGTTDFMIKCDKDSPLYWYDKEEEDLTEEQLKCLGTDPAYIFKYAQFLKRKFQNEGCSDVEIYANNTTWVNGKSFQLVSSDTDLANVKWTYFGHDDWIQSP